jgi:hypothetical protein
VTLVSRKLGICIAFTLLIACSSGFAQTSTFTKTEIAISVYDYANLAPNFLLAAEGDAQRVFRQAGIETTWINCLTRTNEKVISVCESVDTTHLVLKVLSKSLTAKDRHRNDLLGDALVDDEGAGFYAYAFYDGVQRIAEQHRLGHALFGSVLVHEIGHLLLGSHSHSVSGIMSAHWNSEELLKISQGSLLFSPSQSASLKQHVNRRVLQQTSAARASEEAVISH